MDGLVLLNWIAFSPDSSYGQKKETREEKRCRVILSFSSCFFLSSFLLQGKIEAQIHHRKQGRNKQVKELLDYSFLSLFFSPLTRLLVVFSHSSRDWSKVEEEKETLILISPFLEDEDAKENDALAKQSKAVITQ